MKKQETIPQMERFPEYISPKLGEKVQSFKVRDAQGQKRTVYVRDEKNGYPYPGKDK